MPFNQSHDAQDYDRQLQRALNYEDFTTASELRQRREQLTEAVSEFQVWCSSMSPGMVGCMKYWPSSCWSAHALGGHQAHHPLQCVSLTRLHVWGTGIQGPWGRRSGCPPGGGGRLCQ